MLPKKIKITIQDSESEPLEVLVEKKTRYPNDYKLVHDYWKFFQFDGGFRPDDYAVPIGKTFRGYIVGKGKQREIKEVIIKILE
jgi:hypothetical protein